MALINDLIPLSKTVYENKSGKDKTIQTVATKFGAYDATKFVEQMVQANNKLSEIIDEVNGLGNLNGITGSKIQLGTGSDASLSNSISIGLNNKSIHNPIFGAAGGNEATNIGEEGINGTWRGTNNGAKGVVLGQSSTNIGAGGESLAPHGFNAARGGIATRFAPNNIGSVGLKDYFFGASHSHKFRMGLTGMKFGTANDKPYENDPVAIKGACAYDYRPYHFTDKASFNRYDEVVYNKRFYVCARDGVTTAPTFETTNADWFWWDILNYPIYFESGNASYDFTDWNVNAAIGRGYKHNGNYYLRMFNTSSDAPDINTNDFVLIAPAMMNGDTIEVPMWDIDAPQTLNTGEAIWAWDAVWIAKSNGVNSAPPKDKLANANYFRCEPVYIAWRGDYANMMAFTTKCDGENRGGHLALDGGWGQGLQNGGDVLIRRYKRTVNESDPYARNTQLITGYRLDGDTGNHYFTFESLVGERMLEFGGVDSESSGYRTLRIAN